MRVCPKTTSNSLRRLLAAFGVAVAAAAWAPETIADLTPADRETARALVKEGDELVEAKAYDKALAAYRGAHALMNVPTTGMAVVRTLLKLNRLMEARDAALQTARILPAEGDPEVFTTARDEASALVEDLEARIPSIRVDVRGIKQLSQIVVSIDGQVIPRKGMFLPRKVNPGKHLVSATAPRVDTAEAEVIVAERENAVVRLRLEGPASLDAAPEEHAPEAASEAPRPDTGSRRSAPRSDTSTTLAYVGLIGGGVALVIGAGTGIASWNKTRQLKKECTGDACPRSLEGGVDTARHLATASNISFAVAVAACAFGIYGAATMVEAPPKRPKRVSVRPVLGLGSAGFEGSF